ncbi:MAG: peptidylprolyl isomerase [Bryobacteraceae bacterium]
MKRLFPALLLALLIGCSSGERKPAEVKKEAAATKQAPPEYKVKVTTSKGDFTIAVHRDWAPRGADRFYELVKMGFYDDSRFFRVVKDFIVQFGLAKDPKMSQMMAQSSIQDDPAMKSNMKGRVSFAKNGVNTRTSQVFISLKNNRILDDQNFAPFGEVVEGIEVVAKLYPGYGDYSGPEQAKIIDKGNDYLDRSFPRLDKLQKAILIP